MLSIACLGLTFAGCGGPGRATADRPAILLITVDSLRADRLGYAGYEAARTPGMDALAARGAVFTNARTTAPEAPAAIASVLTGLYPAAHGLRTAHRDTLDGSVPTLAAALGSAGYRTAAVAGSLLLHPRYGLGRGFDLYAAAFNEIPHPSQIPEVGIIATEVADRALEFLETARDTPFFLWVNFYDPHDFYTPPEPFKSDFADHPYDGEIAYVDQEVGRLLERLREYGIDGRTIVVLCGTNGEGLGDHGEAFHGVTLQEATVRVPLVIAAPGFHPGERIDTPVSLADLAPTLLELAHVDRPGPLDGQSLTGTPDPARPIYMQTVMAQRLFGWSPLTGVVSGHWKYVAGVRGELYDLIADPGESRDLSAGQAAIRDRLAALVSDYEARDVRAGRDLPAAAREAIAALGYPTSPAPRTIHDPRDMTRVANDAMKGHRQLMRRSVQAAGFLIEGVLRDDPDNYTGLLGSALLAGARQDLKAARALLDRTQALYPGTGEIYLEMAHLITAAGDPDAVTRSRALYGIAAILDPLQEEAIYNLACALAVEGKRDEALDTLQQAVDAGFRDYPWMAVDKDLDSLRDDPRFDVITEGKVKKKTPPAATP